MTKKTRFLMIHEHTEDLNISSFIYLYHSLCNYMKFCRLNSQIKINFRNTHEFNQGRIYVPDLINQLFLKFKIIKP